MSKNDFLPKDKLPICFYCFVVVLLQGTKYREGFLTITLTTQSSQPEPKSSVCKTVLKVGHKTDLLKATNGTFPLHGINATPLEYSTWHLLVR